MLKQILFKTAGILFLFKKKTPPKDPKKILIIRAGMLGDVLMTTPLISSIRKRYPQAQIHYLVGEWSKDALKGNKDIDSIMAFDDTIIFRKKLFQTMDLIAKLRKQRFDLCFILDKSYLWNTLALASKIKFRIGFDRNKEGFCNNLNVKFDGTRYELDYYIEICRLLNINPEESMRITISGHDENMAQKTITKHSLKDKTIIGIAPGGAKNPGQEMAVKRWPKEKYISLIDSFPDLAFLIFGGKDDYVLAEEIAKKTKAINLAGKYPLSESAALIKKCSLFITHDSGLMHLAAAVNTLSITLFGPTPSIRFAPKNSVVIKSSLKCSPCYDIYGNYKKCNHSKCMESISTTEVESAIHKVLKDKERSRS